MCEADHNTTPVTRSLPIFHSLLHYRSFNLFSPFDASFFASLTILPSPQSQAIPIANMSISLVYTYAINARQTHYFVRNNSNGNIWWEHSNTMPESAIKSSPPVNLPRCGHLNPDAFFTKCTSTMHRYSGALENHCVFVKYTNIIRFADMQNPPIPVTVKGTQEREIWAAQKYRSAPHPNIC